MNQLARRPLPRMTADDFLAWPGDGSGRTFQLVDGEVRPVSPASPTHALIQGNLVFLLKLAVRVANLPLFVMPEGAIIPGSNAGSNVRVPDVVVTAAPDERDRQAVPDPVLSVEVLSPGDQDDTRDNIRAYTTLPSVREIAVLHSSRILAEVHRRGPDGAWQPHPEAVGPGKRLCLPGVGLDCALEDAYAGTWIARGPGVP